METKSKQQENEKLMKENGKTKQSKFSENGRQNWERKVWSLASWGRGEKGGRERRGRRKKERSGEKRGRKERERRKGYFKEKGE